MYDDSIAQERIFNETSLPIVESVVQGYNGTIFAYGQTGTGKTHTMEGDIKSDLQKGVTPRCFEMIFNLIKATYNTNYLIRVSYLELYNEEIKDLLSKSGNSQSLEIKENPEVGFYVKDLSTWVVKSPSDMIQLLEKGKEVKHVASTNMNDRSSRSHCIFSVIVDNSTTDENGEEHIRTGKLNLVDLAGSERQKKTGATGDTLQEGIKINLSLTALGKVIYALVADKKGHVPYRDSKLTKLLMDSLGGNSKTVMIANIGPADDNYDETLTTLRYANRAKDIKNAPKINEDPKDAMIRQYQEELSKLKKALAEAAGSGLQIEGLNMTGGVGLDKIISGVSKKKIEEMEEKIRREKEEILKEVENEKKKIEDSKNHAEDEKLKLLDKLKLKQEEQDKQNKNKEKLLQKLKMIEEKFVVGEENEKKAKENEELIHKVREEIEKKEKVRLHLQKEYEKNEEISMNILNMYDNQKSEIKEKERIYEKLNQKLKELENERDDLNREFEAGYNEFYEYKRQLEKDINYKDVLTNHVIPKKYLNVIESLMDFDEESGEWYIQGMDEYLHHVNKMENSTDEPKQMLAMGFNDDEDCKIIKIIT